MIAQNNGENDDPFRHFDSDGIRKLFEPPKDPTKSETQTQLDVLKSKRKTYDQLNNLIERLDECKRLHAGIHDHNLVFDPGML